MTLPDTKNFKLSASSHLGQVTLQPQPLLILTVVNFATPWMAEVSTERTKMRLTNSLSGVARSYISFVIAEKYCASMVKYLKFLNKSLKTS